MKRLILGFSILAGAAIFVLSCKKPAPSPAPEPDTDTKLALDVIWATYIITDVEQMGAFIGENLLYDHFYIAKPWSPYKDCPTCGTVTATRDSAAKSLGLGFNKTYCVDDKYREGTIFINYNYNIEVNNYLARDRGILVDPHARFYHDYGYCGLLTLSGYKVDNWGIRTKDGAPATIYCMLESAKFDPKVVKLTWKMAGDFILENPAYPDSTITWTGQFTKTLLNSTDAAVWKATTDHKNDGAVTWSLALVSYSGAATGMLYGSPYAIEFGQPSKNPAEKPKPLIRDFTCSSDPVYGAAQGTGTSVLVPLKSRHHPFVRGIMSFSTGIGTSSPKYPREIYFGDDINYNTENAALNDWDADLMTTNTSTVGGDRAPCDNSGEILIKGITYRVDFRK